MATTTPTTTLRTQILTLQQQLAAEQPQVATDLKTLLQSTAFDDLLTELVSLRDRAMPNGPIDGQISNLLTVIGNINNFAIQNEQMLLAMAAQNAAATNVPA